MTPDEKFSNEVMVKVRVAPVSEVFTFDRDSRTNCRLEDVVQEKREAEEARKEGLEFLFPVGAECLVEMNDQVNTP